MQVGGSQNITCSQQRAGGPHIGGDIDHAGGRRANEELPTVVPNVNGRRYQREWGRTQVATRHINGDFPHTAARLVHDHSRVGSDDDGGATMVVGFFAMKAQGNDGVVRLDVQHGQVGTVLIETFNGLNNCVDAIGEHSFLQLAKLGEPVIHQGGALGGVEEEPIEFVIGSAGFGIIRITCGFPPCVKGIDKRTLGEFCAS